MSGCLTMPDKIRILIRLASPVCDFWRKKEKKKATTRFANVGKRMIAFGFGTLTSRKAFIAHWRCVQAALSPNRLRRLPDALSDTPESSIANSVASICN